MTGSRTTCPVIRQWRVVISGLVWGWLSCKPVAGTISVEEVTHLQMLSDDRLCHEKHRMCWNSQLGMRVVPGTWTIARRPVGLESEIKGVERPGQRGYGGKVLEARFCWPLLLLGESRFWSIFLWILTCYGLCFEEITNVWWIYGRGHGQGYTDSPEEGFCWDLCIRSFVEIGIQRGWEAVRMLRAETTELTI